VNTYTGCTILSNVILLDSHGYLSCLGLIRESYIVCRRGVSSADTHLIIIPGLCIRGAREPHLRWGFAVLERGSIVL